MSAPASAAASGGVLSLRSLDEHAALLASSSSAAAPASSSTPLVVLLFTTPWHPPCKQMRTVIEQLALQHPNVKFAEVDAEGVSDVTELYPVESVPTTVLLRAGSTLATLEGANAVQLTQLVQQHSRAAAGASAPAAAAAPVAAAPASASSASAAAAAPAESKEARDARLRQLVSASPVMAFIKGTVEAPRCGFTKQLLALLAEQGVQFGTFDILSDPAVREGLKSFSNWPTYPQLYVSGELVGGLDIVKELAASGELASSIPAGHIKPKIGASAAAAAPPAAAQSLDDRLHALVRRSRVMLFMKGSPQEPQCGFSRKAVALLHELGCADFGHFDIFSDQEVREGLKKFSNWPTYPQLYIDGELVGGLDVMQEMSENGELTDMLNAPPPLEPAQEAAKQ